MANTTDSKGNPLFSRSAQQSSRIFGFDQQYWGGGAAGTTTASPRPKFLFFARFVRGVGEGSSAWQDGMTFAVRKVERPKVAPQLQTLNQYNKKRVIQTGIKYDPVTIEFHDTSDSVVYTMWHEYAAYHYGDLRRSEAYDWSYDATLPDFHNQGQGFGFTLPAAPTGTPSSLESGNFFERIECYQFFGRQYIRFDLVHPKISMFNPDEMDYEGQGSHGISMNFEYETITYHNNNQPKSIDSSTELGALVTKLMGDNSFNPPTGHSPNILDTNIPFFGNVSRVLTKIPTTQYGVLGTLGQEATQVTTLVSGAGQLTGALGAFGKFDFGGTDSNSGSNVLSNIANSSLVNSGKTLISSITGSNINNSSLPASGLGGQAYDAGLAKAQASGSGSDAMTAANMSSDLMGTLNSASSTSQVGTRTAVSSIINGLGSIF